jgi:hypothetical protein
MPVLLALLFFNYSGQHKQNKKRVTKHGWFSKLNAKHKQFPVWY